MKNKWYWFTYGLLALLAALSYWPARNFLVQQEPSGTVVVSNLTVNYVLMFCLAGGASPHIVKRFFPRAPKWAPIVLTCIIVVLLLQLMKLFGYQTRWF